MSDETIEIQATKKHYLTSREFYTAVIESQIKGFITDKLARMFMLLAERTANHRRFVRYHHIRADIISVSILACVKGFPNFAPYKDKTRYWDRETMIDYNHEICSNVHAFFTTCIFNALKQFLGREYNQSNINNKMRLQLGIAASEGYCEMIREQEARDAEESEEGEVVDGSPFDGASSPDIDDLTVWDDYESDDGSLVDTHVESLEEDDLSR